MRCQNCGRNEANVFYTQNINGKKSEICLCSECAGELNVFDTFSNHFDFGFYRMFCNFFDDFGNLGLLELPRLSLGRRGNFITEEDYYDRGNPELDEALKNITSKNKGLTKKEKLEKELKECIQKENYERAAEIRDELKKYSKDDKND